MYFQYGQFKAKNIIYYFSFLFFLQKGTKEMFKYKKRIDKT